VCEREREREREKRDRDREIAKETAQEMWVGSGKASKGSGFRD